MNWFLRTSLQYVEDNLNDVLINWNDRYDVSTWIIAITNWNLVLILSNSDMTSLYNKVPDKQLCEKIEAVCLMWRYVLDDAYQVWSIRVPYLFAIETLKRWRSDFVYRIALWLAGELKKQKAYNAWSEDDEDDESKKEKKSKKTKTKKTTKTAKTTARPESKEIHLSKS